MEFTLDFIPPTVTAHEHKIRIVHGRPMFYDTQKLKAARAAFERLLIQHRPATTLEGPVALNVDWHFATKTHKEGTYRVTRPDTDNLQKLLKDCMTRVGFWRDNAQVCREEVTKRWSREKPGSALHSHCRGAEPGGLCVNRPSEARPGVRLPYAPPQTRERSLPGFSLPFLGPFWPLHSKSARSLARSSSNTILHMLMVP